MVQATLSVVFVSRWIYLAEVRLWMVWCVLHLEKTLWTQQCWSYDDRNLFVQGTLLMVLFWHVDTMRCKLHCSVCSVYSIIHTVTCKVAFSMLLPGVNIYICICLSYLSHTLVLRQCAKSNIHFAKQQTRSLGKVEKYFKHNHHKCTDFCCRTWGHFNWPCQDKVDICSLK